MYAILLLVALLHAPSWHVREAASTALHTHRHAAAPYLIACESSPCPEVRMRAGRILAVSRAERLRGFLALWQPTPYIDSLPRDFPGYNDIIAHYRSIAWELDDGPGDVGMWKNDRRAGRLFLTAAFLGGDSEELRRLADRMAARSAVWDKFQRWPD